MCNLRLTEHSVYNQREGLSWVKDQESVYLAASNGFVETFGFRNHNQIKGSTDYDLVSGAAALAPTLQQHDSLAMQTRKNLRILEIQPSLHDKWIVILTTKQPIIEPNGEITGTKGTAVDLTEIFTSMPKLLSAMYFNKVNQLNKDKPLTMRQAECLHYLVRGKSAKEIAVILGLSIRTVEHYIEHLKLKFSCSKKSELVDKCVELGLISIIPDHLIKTQSSIILNDM